MNHRKLILPLLSFSLIALTACDPDAQDSGSASKVAVNGISEDGFVSGATVWHDVNDNKELDSGEPFATTDEKGYFSRSRAISGESINYCATSATTAQKKHCLQINALNGVSSEVILRLQEGIDIITGEPFVGSISLKTTVSASGVISDVVATPITALITHLSAAELTAFAAREGETEDFLKSDFLDFVFESGGTADANQVAFIKAALQVHKSVELANTLLLKRYPIVGEVDVPSDASDFVYEAIARAFIASDAKLSEFMESGISGSSTFDTTQNTLATIFQSAEAELVKAIKSGGKVQGTDEGFPNSSINRDLWVGLSARVLDITASIKTAITEVGVASFDKDEIFSRARAVEVIKETIKNKIESFDYANGDPNDGDLDTASIPALVNAKPLLAASIVKFKAEGDSIDLAAVATGLVASATLAGAYDANIRPVGAKLFNGITTFLSGKEIILSNGGAALVTDTFTSVFAKPKSKLQIYFKAPDNTASDLVLSQDETGELIICNKFNDGKAKKNISETESRFIGGTWRKVNDFTVQLNAIIAGSQRTIIVKSVGLDGSGNRKFTAKINTELEDFTADRDLDPTGPNTVVPSDVATCLTALQVDNSES